MFSPVAPTGASPPESGMDTARNPAPLPTEWTPERRCSHAFDREYWIGNWNGVPALLKRADQPVDRQRLLREAGRLARLRMPHFPPLLGVDPAGSWLVMGLVDGVGLLRWANGRSLTERIGVFRQLTEALAALHATDLVHGDLKPEHVLIDQQGNLSLIDLESPEDPARLSPGHAAPERLEGAPSSKAADLWALGIIGWSLLMDRPPDSSGVAPDPRHHRPLPATLARLLQDLLAPLPEARPSAAEAVVRAARMGGDTPPLPVSAARILRTRAEAALRGGATLWVTPAAGPMVPHLLAEAGAIARRLGLPLRVRRETARDGQELEVVLGEPPCPRSPCIHLPPPPAGLGQALLQAVREGIQSVDALSVHLGLSAPRVVDLAEPLVDLGLLHEQADGVGFQTPPHHEP